MRNSSARVEVQAIRDAALVLAKRKLRAGLKLTDTSRFSDDVWLLDMNAATPTTAAATPGAQDATLPATTDTTAVNETAPADDSDRGFPWGVLGLVGLIGLLGVRKVKA